jgi:hypothetical protein
MRIPGTRFLLFVLVVFWPSGLYSQAQERQQHALPTGLSESTNRVLFDGSAFSGPTTAIPHWDNGYLVANEVETWQPGTPNVRLYDRSGRQVLSAAISFPGERE